MLTVVFGVLALITLVVIFAEVHWTFELFSHYRPHFAIAFVVLTLGCVIRERYLLALISLALTAFHALVLAVHWLPLKKTPTTIDDTVRVMALNLSEKNRRIDLVASLIDREKPLLIGLSEITSAELTTLESVTGDYHKAVNTDVAGFGVAFLARVPIENARSIQLGDQPFPAMVVDLTVNELPMRVVVAHPPPPISEHWAKAHAAQLRSLNQLVREDTSRSVIVLGDLNATRWSPGFMRLIGGTDLRSASLGFPYRPTWPQWAGPLGIPIDHCLVGPRVVVNGHRVGPKVGSDHLPVIIDLAVRPQ